MAEFFARPSWITTLRFMGHVLMPNRVQAKGFLPLSVRERQEIAGPLFFLKVVTPIYVASVGALTGIVIHGADLAAGLIVAMLPLVVGPLGAVTVVWLGLKNVAIKDEGEE